MVTYMDLHTVLTYISVTCTRRTLRMPSFTRETHAQPSLSNFPRRDSDFGERARSRGMTQLEQNFPTSPQNKKTKLTHCSIYVPMRTISTPQIKGTSCSPQLGSHKGANREMLEVYSNPQTGPLSGPPESYFPDFMHTNLNQIK